MRGRCARRSLDANANAGLDTIAFNIPGAGIHTIAPATHLPFVIGPRPDRRLHAARRVPEHTPPSDQRRHPDRDRRRRDTDRESASSRRRRRQRRCRGLAINRRRPSRGQLVRPEAAGNCVVRGQFSRNRRDRPHRAPEQLGRHRDRQAHNDTGRRDVARGPQPRVGKHRRDLQRRPSQRGQRLDVQGNLVGTDATGLHALPNAEHGGLRLGTVGGTAAGAATSSPATALRMWTRATPSSRATSSGSPPTASLLSAMHRGHQHPRKQRSTIGGIGPGEGNDIAYNGAFGVDVGGIRNAVRGNSIHDNGFSGSTSTPA